MYNIQQAVGRFFERLLAKEFGLRIIDGRMSSKVPDLKCDKFYIEVKASRYDNGGVIKKFQLRNFGTLEMECLYAFPYHEAQVPMRRYYPTERSLERSLQMKSLYILPFEVAKAHYTHFERRPYRKTGDDFTQIRESLARDIFGGKAEVWSKLQLNFDNYYTATRKKNEFILTGSRKILNRLLKHQHHF